MNDKEYRVPLELLENENLSNNEKMLMIHLLNNKDLTENYVPLKIAVTMGLSEVTLKKCVKNLQNIGYIAIEAYSENETKKERLLVSNKPVVSLFCEKENVLDSKKLLDLYFENYKNLYEMGRLKEDKPNALLVKKGLRLAKNLAKQYGNDFVLNIVDYARLDNWIVNVAHYDLGVIFSNKPFMVLKSKIESVKVGAGVDYIDNTEEMAF